MRTQHSNEKPFVCDVEGCGYAGKLLHHLTGECCDSSYESGCRVREGKKGTDNIGGGVG